MIEITQRPDGRIQIKTPYTMVDLCRAIAGRRWDVARRAWHMPATPAVACAVIAAVTDVEPEFVAPQFLAVLAQHEGQAELLRAETSLPPIPLTVLPPWSNQLRGYHMIDRQAATFLAWEMGTGKTKPVVDAVVNIKNIQRAIVLCPSSVVAVWPKEFEKHAATPVHVVALSKGAVKKRTAEAIAALKWAERIGQRCVIVINFEAAWREPFAAWAMAVPWDIVIADESHRVKSPGGKASKYLAKLGKDAGRRVCLTGTPMPHSPLDVYAQFRFLDPGIYGTSFTNFRARYAVMGGFENHQVLSYQNLDDLHNKFFSIADRVKKTDVLDLPPFVHEERIIELSPSTRRVYNDLETEMIADVGRGVVTASNALARLIRLQQATSGYAVIESDVTDHHGVPKQEIVELDADKQKALRDLLENDIEPGQPIIVFCRFHHDLDAVHTAAAAAGRQSVELSGRRNEVGSVWVDGPDTVAAIQIQAGGVGVDLTRAHVAVYYSIGFNGGDYLQSLARPHRHGQEHNVTYIHFIAEKTVDRKIRRALSVRAAIVESVLTQAPDVIGSVLKQYSEQEN